MYTLKAGKCKGQTPLVMLDSLWGHSSTPSPRVGGTDLPSSQRPKKAFLHATAEALVPASWHMSLKLPLPGESKTKARNRRCTFCSSSPSFFNTPKLKKKKKTLSWAFMNKAHSLHAQSKVQRALREKQSTFAGLGKWPLTLPAVSKHTHIKSKERVWDNFSWNFILINRKNLPTENWENFLGVSIRLCSVTSTTPKPCTHPGPRAPVTITPGIRSPCPGVCNLI